ncbi:MAG: PadR family transcriptional regulator [Candidatus Thorarchaeota archaeon]
MLSKNYSLKHRSFVILGLINEKMHEGGCHAYDINKRIEERGMRDWTNIGLDFSLSTIYRRLDKLENDELVESFEEEIDNRIRKIYKITEYGYNILKKKVYDVLYNYLGKNDEDFYVAFSMFPILSHKEQIEVFSHALNIINKHRMELNVMLDDMLINFPQMPINVTGLFLHPIKILKTDEEFFEMVLKKIKEVKGKNNHTDYKSKEVEKI